MASPSTPMKQSFRWRQTRVVGASLLKNHTACAVGGRLYIYGGYSLRERLNHSTTLLLDCSSDQYTLQRLDMEGEFVPTPRNGHTANVVDDKLFVFGGWGGNSVSEDVYILDLILYKWHAPAMKGTRHSLLNMHVSEYVDYLGQIVCFGGGDGQSFLNDTTALNVRSMSWSDVKPKGFPPEERSNSSSCMQGHTMYVFGGWNHRATLNDIHLLYLPENGIRASWSSPKIDEAKRPLHRVGAGFVSFRNKLVLFGGYNYSTLGDVQIFDPVKKIWLQPSQASRKALFSSSDEVFHITGPTPATRSGHTFTVIANKYILAYGGSGNGYPGRGIPDIIHTLHPL